MTDIAIIPLNDVAKSPLWFFLKNIGTCVANPSPWPDAMDLADDLLSKAVCEPRTPELEADESKLQLVVYCLVTTDNKFWTYRRKGTEGRLHGLKSIGFGGHVEVLDDLPDIRATVAMNLRKELAEELPGVVMTHAPEFIGFVFDDSTPVGRVHLGLVYLAKTSQTPDSVISEECGEITLEAFDAEDTEPWAVKAHGMTIEYLRLKEKLTHVTFKGTLLRSAGSTAAFTSPERDLAVVAAELLSETAISLFTRNWAVLDDLVAGEDHRVIDGVPMVVECIEKILQDAVDIESGTKQFAETCLQNRWFALPSKSRAIVLSHLGLALLGRAWVMLRQYVRMGHDIVTDYRETSKEAGRFVAALVGHPDANTTIASIVREAKRSEVELGRLLQMVEEAYQADEK